MTPLCSENNGIRKYPNITLQFLYIIFIYLRNIMFQIITLIYNIVHSIVQLIVKK